MAIDFLDSRKTEPTHSVRVLSPDGIYPDKSIINENSALYISKEICFSIVPFNDQVIEIENYYSEVEWLTINEIRLFSSILLCVDRNIGYFCVFPFPTLHHLIIADNEPLKNILPSVAKKLVDEINAPPQVINEVLHPNTNPYRGNTSKGITLPTVCGGNTYSLREEEGGYCFSLQSELFNKFDIKDSLMIRAVSTLLRAAMLTAYHYLMEEAINTTFISLDASFSLILRVLKNKGMKNPSSQDAEKFIASVFQYEAGDNDKYFEDFYNSRIMSFHPESRFGMFPHAPLMVDDCYDLFDRLLEIYRYLLCGYVHPISILKTDIDK